jgi:hypothetical protein
MAFTGCSAAEVLHPSGLVVVKVPGLCQGGDTDPSASRVGYIAFVRGATREGDSSAESALYSFYRNKVLLPFVAQVRTAYFGHEPGTPVPEELRAAVYCDGANLQLKAITNPEQQLLDKELKICDGKQAGGATGTQQPCDLSPVFRLLKQMEKQSKSEDMMPCVQLRRIIVDVIKSNSDIVCLAKAKVDQIAGFASRLPAMMARVVSAKNIQRGFVEAGMLDDETRTRPSFDGMLATCRRPLTTEEVDLVKQTLPELYSYAAEHGIIPESLFDHLGYAKDLNSSGEVVERLAEITNEPCQRAKVVKHPGHAAGHRDARRLENLRHARIAVFDQDEGLLRVRNSYRHSLGLALGHFQRNKEHGRSSQLLTTESKSSEFYNSYPAMLSESYSTARRKGWFVDLSLYVGIGFSRADTAAVSALCVPTDGVLCWTTKALHKTSTTKFAGCKTNPEKQLHMVGYLFELFYDLMLSPDANVLRSPGFETCLGIFGGS